MKKVTYITTDNISLNGIYENNNSKTCVIMCHGIRSDKTEHGNFVKLSQQLNKEKIDNFRFDFRGHGDNLSSFEEVTISREIVDLESTLDFITNNYNKIILLGASFGAGIVSLINYKKYEDIIKGLVLWYPCIIYKKTNIFTNENVQKAIDQGFIETNSIITGKSFRFSEELMVETTKFNPFTKLENNNLPKLFIHGDKDLSVDYTSTIECAKKSPNSELIILKNGTHGFFTEPMLFNQVIDKTIIFIKNLAINQ